MIIYQICAGRKLRLLVIPLPKVGSKGIQEPGPHSRIRTFTKMSRISFQTSLIFLALGRSFWNSTIRQGISPAHLGNHQHKPSMQGCSVKSNCGSWLPKHLLFGPLLWLVWLDGPKLYTSLPMQHVGCPSTCCCCKIDVLKLCLFKSHTYIRVILGPSASNYKILNNRLFTYRTFFITPA
jgi:hypothetical protein